LFVFTIQPRREDSHDRCWPAPRSRPVLDPEPVESAPGAAPAPRAHGILASERDMSLPTSRALLAATALAAVVLAAGCGEPALRSETAPSTHALRAGGALIKGAPRSGTLLDNVRNVNLRTVVLSDPRVSATVKDVIRSCNECGLGNPVYRDLTGDRIEDVLVPIDSGGSSGVIAFYVYSPQHGRLRDVFAFEHELGLVVSVHAADIVLVLPVYHADDPHCCPYARETRVYHWKNGAFHLTHRELRLQARR
jgi:hypothetical protein